MSRGKRPGFGKKKDRVGYVLETLDRLIEGGYVTEGEDGHVKWAEVDPTYLDLRSLLETQGDVSADWVSEVLDLERAFAKLMQDYPVGGLVVAAVIMGVDVNELTHLLGEKLHMSPAKLLDKSTAYMQAYLNGRDPKVAWKKGRRALV